MAGRWRVFIRKWRDSFRSSVLRKKPNTKSPATWIKPELVCEVRFTAWTGGHLRHPIFLHPIFLGMREGQARAGGAP
jgi:ATP-dependent DNA ligase